MAANGVSGDEPRQASDQGRIEDMRRSGHWRHGSEAQSATDRRTCWRKLLQGERVRRPADNFAVIAPGPSADERILQGYAGVYQWNVKSIFDDNGVFPRVIVSPISRSASRVLRSKNEPQMNKR